MSGRKKLPKGWRWAKLGDVADFDGGMAAPQDKRVFQYGTVPFVRMQDLGRCHQTDSLCDTTNYLREDYVLQKKVRLFPPKSILMPRSGSVYLNHRAMLGVEAAVVSHIAILTVQEGFCLPEFLYHFLCTVDMGKWSPRTTGLDSLNFSVVKEQIEIPLPPLAVQEWIVEVLQQADAIRRKRAETRRLADQIISSVFKQFFRKTKVKRKPLAALLVCPPQYGTSERANSLRDGYPVLRIPNVLSGELDTSNMKYIPSITEKEKKLFVSPGDILLVRTNGNRDYVGRCSVVPEVDQKYIFASYLMRLRPDPEKVLSEYLDAFLRTQDARTQMLRNIPTSAGNYNINAKNLSQIEIPVPDDKDIQRRFAHIIKQQRSYGARVIQSEETGTALFQVLLSHVFTGELTAEWEAANADWIAERQTFYERLPRLALLSLLLERRSRAGRDSVTLITALMKYAFLAQMEGELRRRLYRFIPYHYGPCAMELYDDLKALAAEGLITVENDAEEDKTRITLTEPARAAALLEKEANKDELRLAAFEGHSDEETDIETDPATTRLLKRRAEILETLRADVATILDTYGNLDHSALLKTVYEKYPNYAKNSRVRKTRDSC